MKKYFLFIFLLLTSIVWAQKLDLIEIKEKVSDSKSTFYYKKLIIEFKNNPEILVLDSTKSKYLYYGKLFSEYNNKTRKEQSDNLKFLKQVTVKKYDKAVELGERLIDKDPVNLMVLINLRNCYSNLQGNQERVAKLKTQIEIILKAIALYGDGRNKETGFKVISLRDEYTLLSYMKFDLKKYVLTSEKLSKEVVLDLWEKDKNYKDDHRDKVYLEVLSNNTKTLNKN